MTQDAINQSEWNNPANWSVLKYSSTRDSRLFVRTRRGNGWTINFGHAGGKFVFGAFLALQVLVIGLVLITLSHYDK
jgi:uncharacterized membrane protein